MADDAPAPPGPDPIPPGSPPPPRRRLRKALLYGTGSLLVLLGLLVLLLPTILSSGWAKGILEGKATAAAGRRITLASHAIGWGSSKAEGLIVRYGEAPDDPVALRVEEVRAEAGIATALGSRYDVGRVEVLGPTLRIDRKAWEAMERRREEKGKGKEEGKEAGEAPPAGAGAGRGPETGGNARTSIPPFSVALSVRNGSILLVEPDGKERRLGTFEADLAASDAGPAEGTFALDLGASGKVRLKAKATPFREGRPVPPGDLEAAVEAVLESLDLAALREAIPPAGGLELRELRGLLDGSVSGRTGPGGSLEDGKAALTVKGLLAAGSLGGREVRIDEPAATVDAAFRLGGDGAVEVRDSVLRAPGVEVRAGAARAPGGALTGSATVRADVARSLERAHGLGFLLGTKAVGDLTLEARALGDGNAQRCTGSLVVVDGQISPGRGLAPVDEPRVALEFDLVREGKSIRLDTADLRSRSMEATLRGRVADDLSAADLSVKASASLDRLAKVASGLGHALPGAVSGSAVLEATLRRGAESGDEAKGTLTIRDLSVTPPGDGGVAVREEEVRLSFDAVPGTKEVAVRSLRLRGAGLDVSLAGKCASDFAAGDFHTLESSADLSKALSLAEAVLNPLPLRVSGSAAWNGPLSWKDRFGTLEIRGGRLLLKGLEARLPGKEGAPGRVFREEEVAAVLAATLTRRADGSGYDAALGPSTLAAKGLDLKAEGKVHADGALDLRASGTAVLAEALRRAVEGGFLGKAPSPAGSIDFDLDAKGTAADLALDLRRLEARDAPFSLSGSGSFASKGGASLALAAGGDLPVLLDLARDAGFGSGGKDAAGTVAARVEAKAAGADAPLSVVLEGTVKGLRLPDPSGGPAWTQSSVAASVRAAWDRKAGTATGTASLLLDDGSAKAEGSLSGLAGADRAVDATVDLDLDLAGLCRSRPDLLPLPEMAVGKVTGKGKVKGPLGSPFDATGLQGSGRLALDSVRTRPFEVRDAVVDAVFQGGTVNARSIEATVNGGKVAGAAVLGLQGAGARHSLEVRATGVRIDPAMAWLLEKVVPVFAAAKEGGVSGVLDADLRLDAEGADWKAARPGLHGAGSLTIREGEVRGSGMVAEVLELLGGGKALPFSAIESSFTVKDRRVWNEKLTVAGRDHSMLLRGSTSFEGVLDYRLGAKALKLSKKATERLRPLLDEDGNLPFRLGGTLDRPKVRAPDLKKALGDAAEDALKKKLKDLLGGGKDE